MFKILIADDDASIRDIIRKFLEDSYTVITAENGAEAVETARSVRPDLIIMDVMMPKLSGIAAVRKIREEMNVPILILSAKAEGSDRVIGLESGADDYLIKPFYEAELLARVQALLRRYTNLGSIREKGSVSVLKSGDIALDTARMTLEVRGEAVHLTPTELRILKFLMENPGHVFPAEEIYAHVWQSEAYAVENTVMVHISRIRDKIEIDPKKPEHLKVIWGIGYVFE